MAGVLSAEVLESRLDENGTAFLAAATAAGYGAGSTQVGGPAAPCQTRHYSCLAPEVAASSPQIRMLWEAWASIVEKDICASRADTHSCCPATKLYEQCRAVSADDNILVPMGYGYINITQEMLEEALVRRGSVAAFVEVRPAISSPACNYVSHISYSFSAYVCAQLHLFSGQGHTLPVHATYVTLYPPAHKQA